MQVRVLLPVQMKWLIEGDRDKTTLLIIFGLTIIVGGSASIAGHFGFLDEMTAFHIDLLAFGWFIGALMVFVSERWVKRHKRREV